MSDEGNLSRFNLEETAKSLHMRLRRLENKIKEGVGQNPNWGAFLGHSVLNFY